MDWRETRDPYRIWVSEIMLQQTRVETVAPYYRRFVERYPDARALAGATLDDVLSAWEGLGYYARARNLHRAAQIVSDRLGGDLPSTVEELSALPGIGRSTAGAIAAIAFGRDEPILDANARRVVARLFAVGGNLRVASTEKLLWERSRRLVKKGKGRETALAVMDLGATVCRPADPRCGECPLSSFCEAFRLGVQKEIPARNPRKAVPHRDLVAAMFRRRDGAVFLLRRPSRGLLGGLWAFPSGERIPGETPEGALRRVLRVKFGVRARVGEPVGFVRHAYSHFRITLRVYLCEARGGKLPGGEGSGWCLPGGPGGYALPRADRKILERIRMYTPARAAIRYRPKGPVPSPSGPRKEKP